MWGKFIEVNNEEILRDIYEVLKDDVENVEFFAKNLRGKMDAFVTRDNDKLNATIDEEIAIIKNVGAGE